MDALTACNELPPDHSFLVIFFFSKTRFSETRFWKTRFRKPDFRKTRLKNVAWNYALSVGGGVSGAALARSSPSIGVGSGYTHQISNIRNRNNLSLTNPNLLHPIATYNHTTRLLVFWNILFNRNNWINIISKFEMLWNFAKEIQKWFFFFVLKMEFRMRVQPDHCPYARR